MHGDYNHLDDLTVSIRQTLSGYRDQVLLEPARMDTVQVCGLRLVILHWLLSFSINSSSLGSIHLSWLRFGILELPPLLRHQKNMVTF